MTGLCAGLVLSPQRFPMNAFSPPDTIDAATRGLLKLDVARMPQQEDALIVNALCAELRNTTLGRSNQTKSKPGTC